MRGTQRRVREDGPGLRMVVHNAEWFFAGAGGAQTFKFRQSSLSPLSASSQLVSPACIGAGPFWS
jgi:hypothetical protein